ncbi:hypothetical protein M378DRAFT_167749 [Amanita muscaria Koide BX008]|uniref:S-adenosylmethionine-dependent methyltransferase n=1 Tax=Amanita muscaria (strain Koide BX008) TaxID=946122 RepID=A0A0C2WVE2_AMAMK|nr:hypothetical protein M378DRAFT_167749 [Amanita muscaria Koide BX008]
MVPTAQLPPIRNITSASCRDLAKALEYVRNLYQPRVRGSRRRRSSSSAKHGTETFEHGHLDPFERNYTTKWLGALISHLELRHFPFPDSDTEELIQSAASLVALCSGTAAAGTLYRDFTFQSNHVLSCSISIRVKDIPLNNQDYSSVGAQTWGGACVLAEMIVVEPWKFGFCSPDTAASLHNTLSTITSLRPLRILELGAGTGLVSLTTAKVLETLMSRYHGSSIDSMLHVVDTSKQSSTAPVTIVATDYYPPVLDNLDSNIAANFPMNADSLVSITSHRLDWAHFSATYGPPSVSSSPVLPAPFDEPFNVILGADIVYELEHATWIKSCLSVLLRKPNSRSVSDVPYMQHPSPIKNSTTNRFSENVFHLVIPLRPTHDKESQTIEAVFPYSECFQDLHDVFVTHDKKRVEDDLSQTESFNTTTAQQLCILSREVIICEKEDGEMVTDDVDDEDGVTYVYYRIGWSSCE